MLSFQPCDVTQPAERQRASDRRDDRPDTLVYLALPPFLLEPVLPRSRPPRGCAPPTPSAIEKPFGTDLASARHLNEILRLRLPEPTIFRIDHFLSSELVRRVVDAAVPQPGVRAALERRARRSGWTSAGWRA